VIHKITNTESENGELKCKIQHLKHASTLENELLKTKLEAKCEQLTEQNKTKTDKINKLITDIEKINNELHDRKNKIETLESSFSTLRNQMELKEQEILSMKMHTSRDDNSGEFQTVPEKSANGAEIILNQQ
jgi:predicted RNase H-like nuclease (RuvC/YqgF family)